MTKKVVSQRAREGENGNTVSPLLKNQRYEYDFVLNNYSQEDIEHLSQIVKENCKAWVYGFEVGEQGTPHIQGYINLIKKNRITGLKTIFGSRYSFREARNREALIKYCQKGENIQKHGIKVPVVIKCISELRPWQKEIEDIFFTEPDGRTINWYWENTGGVGKSSFCKYMYMIHQCLVIQGGKLADIMNIIFNTNMDDVKMMLIDIPRCNRNKVSYSSIECILNGMITNTKYETGTKVFNPPHIVVFSNYEPEIDEDVCSLDRWKVKEII